VALPSYDERGSPSFERKTYRQKRSMPDDRVIVSKFCSEPGITERWVSKSGSQFCALCVL